MTTYLTGRIHLTPIAGDASIVGSDDGAINGPGLPVIAGHCGPSCGTHPYHGAITAMGLSALKPGTVTFEVSFDPDPDPNGDGVPTKTATLTVNIPEFGVPKVQYKTFIQCPIVVNPSYELLHIGDKFHAGDDRSFSSTLGAAFGTEDLGSRSASEVMVNLGGIEPAIVEGSLQAEIGRTETFWDIMGFPVFGSACGWALWPGVLPVQTAVAVPTVMLTESLDGPDGPYTTVHFALEVANPLAAFSQFAPVRGDVTVTVQQCGQTTFAKVWGNSHTAFPAHEVWVEGTNLLMFSPLDPDDPLQLFYPLIPVLESPWFEVSSD